MIISSCIHVAANGSNWNEGKFWEKLQKNMADEGEKEEEETEKKVKAHIYKVQGADIHEHI